MSRRRFLTALVLLMTLCGAAFSQSAPTLVPQAGHSSAVTGVSFSRDGAVLASVSADGQLKLWDVPTRALLHDVRAAQGPLRAVAFSPDDRLLATAGSDGTVAVWDTRTLARLRSDSAGEGPVNAIAFSPDSHLLASTTWRPEEHVVVVRDAASGTPLVPLVAPGGEPRALAFSPDGLLLALGVAGQTAGRNVVELWDLHDGHLLKLLPCPRQTAVRIGFTPDGRRLAAATADGTVELFDVTSGAHLTSLRAGTALEAMAMAPEGNVVAVGGTGGGAVCSLSGGEPEHRLQTRADIRALAWSPDGTVVAGGDKDGNISLWSPTGGLVAGFPAREAWHLAPAFTVDGSLVIQGWREGSAPLTWDSQTLSLREAPLSDGGVTLVDAHSQVIRASTVDGRGHRVAIGMADGRIEIRDRQSGRLVRQLTGHKGAVRALAFAMQGDALVSGGEDGSVRLWDAASGRLQLRLEAGAPVKGVALSLDTALVAAATGSSRPGSAGKGRAIIWDLRTGGSQRVLEGVGDEARCVAFSSHGTGVAVGGSDAAVRLFDTRSGALLRTFEGHTDSIRGVAISPDGALLASGSRDGTVGLWDARDGRRLLTWTTGRGLVASMPRQWIAFDPAGYFVGSEHCMALVGWRTGESMESAERFAPLFYRPDLVEQVLGR